MNFYPRLKRIALTVSAVMAILLLAVYLPYLYAHYPTPDGWFPRCFFWQLTGWKCPGCGMQRALHLLMHGKFTDSFCMCPYAYFAPIAIAFVLAVPRLSRNAVFATAIAVLTIMYTVLRNVLDWQ